MFQKRKGVALYYQILEVMRDKIEGGEWGQNTKIPSELILSKQFDVCRSTVRRSIDELAREGLVVKKQGLGTFVTKPSFVGDIFKFLIPEKFGSLHKVLSIKRKPCDLSLAQKLQIQAKSEIIEIYRVRYFDKDPVMLEKTYLSQRIYQDICEEDFSQRIYPIIRKRYNILLDKQRANIKPIILNDEEAHHLGVLSHALAIMLYRTWINDDKPIMFSKIIFRTDQCKYLVD